ncbi:MAG TPA: ATP-binding protein [Myxococcota bacterium]|nr:ATP-binding protein [Myxococcota bacterium]
MSLRTRLIAILGATAAFAIALALVFQDRTLARDLAHAASARLQHSALAANRLVDAHLSAVSERYRAISGTPQLRANLEVEDPPTLAHYAADLQQNLGAARIVFWDAHDHIAAAAGDESLDALARGYTSSRLAAQDGRLYAVVSVAVGTSADPVGRLTAAERIDAPTLRDWSELCGAEVTLGSGEPVGGDETLVFPVRSLESTWLRVESRMDAEHEALQRSRGLLLVAGGVALAGALAASLVLSRGLAEALRQLLIAADRIGHGDFRARVGIARNDEVGELARAVNEMASRLEEHAATVQRQHRELLDAKDAAEAASRSKTEFLANMSHEIRTPMTAVLGYTELLLSSEARSGEREEWSAAVRRNGADLLQLIDGILDISRVEAGQLELRLQPCRLRRMVEDAAAPIAAAAREKSLEFNFEIDPSCPEVIATDAPRLRQVLANLLQNALKFTEHGSVSLWVGRDSPSTVCFSVRDTGIGIAAKDQEKIFTPFGQADSSHTRRYGGVGLGLSISRRLATMLCGSLTVSSDLGRGSEFRLTLPAPPNARAAEPARERESRALAAAAKPRAFPGARVLLAEDGIDNQRLVRAFLRPLEVELTLVENGAQAVDQALAALDGGRPFELVLMDMQMPVMDGYEATRRLRSEGYEGPIVALTAHAMATDRGRCLEAGCDEYLSKPVDRAALIELVTGFLAARKTDSGASDC